jgi:hypothetical protein
VARHGPSWLRGTQALAYQTVYSLHLALRSVGAKDCVRVVVTIDHEPSDREGRFVRGSGLDWRPSR